MKVFAGVYYSKLCGKEICSASRYIKSYIAVSVWSLKNLFGPVANAENRTGYSSLIICGPRLVSVELLDEEKR